MDEDKNEIQTILLGEMGTGKTNIINAITGLKFDSNKITTNTASFLEKVMKVKDKEYNLIIWDTAGQEKFRSITKIFIKDAKIVIFVYSVTDRRSFEEIDYWYETVKNVLGDKPIFGLAGNKQDLFLESKVTEEEGKKKAEEIGAIFKQTSAKTKMGINDLFQNLLEEYINKYGDAIDEIKGTKLNSCFKKWKEKLKCC